MKVFPRIPSYSMAQCGRYQISPMILPRPAPVLGRRDLQVLISMHIISYQYPTRVPVHYQFIPFLFNCSLEWTNCKQHVWYSTHSPFALRNFTLSICQKNPCLLERTGCKLDGIHSLKQNPHWPSKRHSRTRIRTADLWIMGPARYHCAILLPRIAPSVVVIVFIKV